MVYSYKNIDHVKLTNSRAPHTRGWYARNDKMRNHRFRNQLTIFFIYKTTFFVAPSRVEVVLREVVIIAHVYLHHHRSYLCAAIFEMLHTKSALALHTISTGR